MNGEVDCDKDYAREDIEVEVMKKTILSPIYS